MAKGILWGSDLYKGAKFDSSNIFNLNDVLPFQMLTQDEKTPDWIHAVADHYESVGWRNVERKAGRVQRAYDLRNGRLNTSDYIINPTVNQQAESYGITLIDSSSPIEQFYPIIPNIIDVLKGEKLKRNDSFSILQIDEGAVEEALTKKEEGFHDALLQLVTIQAQHEAAKMGLTESNPEQYQEAIKKAVDDFNNNQAKWKKFKTTGAKWAEKVVKIQEQKFNLKDLDVEGFEMSLIVDKEFWHLDMMEDDFKLHLLNPKWCDFHKGPNVKYISDGDYFLWFDWLSVGDIINHYGTKIKEDDFDKMKSIYSKLVGSLVVPDYAKSIQGGYYDASKPYNEASALNPALNDALLGKELARNFNNNSPNFSTNMSSDIFSPIQNRFNGEPQMFRVMNLYWRSLKKMGWLTKIGTDGQIEFQDWVTEDFKITVTPKYDNSIIKEKNKNNCIYGEHIDWTWVNEWRRIIKISPNQKHSFWLTNDQFSSIYIDGGPCPFQFKGLNNVYESKPPVEGCEFNYMNSTTNSLVDRLKSYQILHNIVMNKVPKTMMNDYGTKLAIDKRTIPVNDLDIEQGQSVIEAYDDSLRDNTLLPYNSLTRESLEGGGQAHLPQLLQLSNYQQTQAYLVMAKQIKDMAGEVVGVAPARQGAISPTETAYGTQQAVQSSEAQTEKYFDQHTKLMQRVRQRMLDAAQYYSTFKEKSKEIYMNEKEENVYLEIEGMQNLFPHYNIHLVSTADMRSVLQQLNQFLIQENTLPFKPSEKIAAIVSQSVPEIMELLKKGEIEADEKAELDHQRQLEMEQERRKTLLAQIEATNKQKDLEKQYDYQRETDVAEIRARGGVQTDVNKNNIPDSEDGLKNYFKQKEMEHNQQLATDNLNFKKEQHTNALLDKQQERNIKQQEMANRMQVEKEKLKIAKTNKNKYDK